MNRLFQTLAFSLMLVATAGNTQTNMDEFPLLGTTPADTDLFIMVDVEGAGNSTKNVTYGNIRNHPHVEADITDLDKYTQAVVDGLLAGKSDTAHTHTEANITDLGAYLETVTAADVDSGVSTDGHVLTSDGAGNAAWEAVSGGGGSSTLDGLTDTTLTSPSDGQVLTYDNATSKWINAASAGGGGGSAGNATSHFLIDEITLATAGEFDFTGLDLSSYDSIILTGTIRSDLSATDDKIEVFLNGVTTGYHNQRSGANNGSANTAETADSNINVVVADSATATYVTTFDMRMEAPAGPHQKHFEVNLFGGYTSSAVSNSRHVVQSNITDAVTRIQVQADGDPTDQLTGTLRLIGVKTVSIEDINDAMRRRSN